MFNNKGAERLATGWPTRTSLHATDASRVSETNTSATWWAICSNNIAGLLLPGNLNVIVVDVEAAPILCLSLLWFRSGFLWWPTWASRRVRRVATHFKDRPAPPQVGAALGCNLLHACRDPASPSSGPWDQENEPKTLTVLRVTSLAEPSRAFNLNLRWSSHLH